MANIIIAGDAVVVKSTLKLEDLVLIKKLRPDALILKGGEDGKEPIFGIGVVSGTGFINKVGASFGSASREDGRAIITMVADGVKTDIKEYIAEEFGAALINLAKLEATLPAVLEEIAAEKAAVVDSITVAE